ncbi:SMC family ATPase [bacterium]|nr:SMC family ATPase [bacterium]
MKPRRLEIEGLRSYRLKQVVEFEPQGLMAITGATGAGKSSLLEAMMFALYGVHSGNSKSNKELIGDRSDEMSVTLEFELQGKIYTAHRSVGRKNQSSFVLAQGDKVLCHDGNRMTAEVIALLGLDEEQFKKTVFLPQGAFQNFLASRPKERTELLKRLLQIEPLDALESRVGLWLGQARQILDRGEGSRARYPADPEAALSAARQALEAALEQDRARQKAFESFAEVQNQLGQSEQIETQLRQRAQLLLGFDRLRSVDEESLNQLAQQLSESLQEAQLELSRSSQALVELRQRTPAYSAAQLAEARRAQTRWRQLQQEGERLQTELLELQAEQAALSEPLSAARAQVEQIQPRVNGLRAGLRDAQARLLELERLREQRRTLESRLSKGVEEVARLSALSQEALQQLAEARQRWREGELWRICGQHSSGEPCPVCERSLPEGWQPPRQPVDLDLEQVERACSEAQSRWQKAESLLHSLQEQLDALPSSFEVTPLEPLQQELAQAEAEANARISHLASLEGELRKINQMRTEREARLPSLVEELQRGQQTSPDNLDQLEAERAAWDQENLRLRQLELEAQGRLQQLQREQAEKVDGPRRELDFLTQQCATALDWNGTELSALLPELDRQQAELNTSLQSSLCLREELAARLSSMLSQHGLDNWNSASAWLREAQDLASRARHQLELCQRQLHEVAELDRLLGPARMQVEKISLLSRLLGHQRSKGSKMTFPQWYLQQRQGELLSLASHHLELLSAGQFRFEEEMDDAQSFRVLDQFSGVPRAVTTLSGGETFLASLSLAVALAELVGRRGGQLQALFLDEGFGTLSAECLDRALSALEQLAAQGRLIGIISHVPLIAERVEQVWWVRKTPAGSEIVKADENLRKELVAQELAQFDPRLHPLFG